MNKFSPVPQLSPAMWAIAGMATDVALCFSQPFQSFRFLSHRLTTPLPFCLYCPVLLIEYV